MGVRDEQHRSQAAPCAKASKQGTFLHVSHLICDRHEDIDYIWATLARISIGEIRSTVTPMDRKNK